MKENKRKRKLHTQIWDPTAITIQDFSRQIPLINPNLINDDDYDHAVTHTILYGGSRDYLSPKQQSLINGRRYLEEEGLLTKAKNFAVKRFTNPHG